MVLREEFFYSVQPMNMKRISIVCLSLERDEDKDLAIQLTKFLFENGFALLSFRELSRSTDVSFSFVDNVPGNTQERVCIHVVVDQTNEKQNFKEEKILWLRPGDVLDRLQAAPFASRVVESGLARLICETEIVEPSKSHLDYMTEIQLHAYYTTAVLPQFGITADNIQWINCRTLGPDEFAHAFTLDWQRYILIFEDYDGLGRDPEFIDETLDLRPQDFEYIVPTSDTNSSPSYTGFHPPTTYKYVEGVTGTFTLLKVRKE
jgi:hypothetical protein